MASLNPYTRLANAIVKTGRLTGSAGFVGRWWGARFGFTCAYGFRILIERPDEYIQQQILMHGIYEPGVASVLADVAVPGTLFLDIGANIGQYSLLMAKKGMDVHAFEPVSRLAECIRRNSSVNNCTDKIAVFRMAVSEKSEDKPFYIANRRDDGSHSLIPGVVAESTVQEIVPTVTLDEHLQRYPDHIATVIKIDIEGAESLVLDGGAHTFSKHNRPIVVLETADRLADVIGESAKSVLERLFNWGYVVFEVDEHTGNLREISMNVVSSKLANYLAVPGESELPRHLLARLTLKHG